MNEVYLDNSSTTKPCRACVEKINSILSDFWGNPSSLHSKGFSAERELSLARSAAAARLFCRAEEICFTSGGTESNNIALFGAAHARRKQGRHIVTTAIEHPSVLNVMKQLEEEGFSVTYLSPDRSGHISAEQTAQAITSETILVSMMAINNEVGSILPLEAAAKAIAAAKSPALLHVDAVQALGKIPLKPSRLKIDLMSISAHKIHGPKGVGALFISKNVHIPARTFGGGQERDLRPGTEPTPLIGGFGAALEALPEPGSALQHVSQLNRRCREGLARLSGIRIHSPDDGLPYILSFSAGHVRAETMLHFLSAHGIFISSGSACAKGKQSHVLTAMGLPTESIASALRVSFCHENKDTDVDALLTVLEEGLRTLAT